VRTTFYLLAIWTAAMGTLAVSMRNLVHCAIALIGFFAGVAGIFFSLHADFLGAVQIIVYVGAVAVLVLFAIMLTRHVTGTQMEDPFSGGAVWGWLIGLAVAGLLIYSLQGYVTLGNTEVTPGLTVADAGNLLMTRFAVPFEVISLFLTAALVGAVVIALDEPKGGRRNLP